MKAFKWHKFPDVQPEAVNQEYLLRCYHPTGGQHYEVDRWVSNVTLTGYAWQNTTKSWVTNWTEIPSPGEGNGQPRRRDAACSIAEQSRL